jgi:hypothetical protein
MEPIYLAGGMLRDYMPRDSKFLKIPSVKQKGWRS